MMWTQDTTKVHTYIHTSLFVEAGQGRAALLLMWACSTYLLQFGSMQLIQNMIALRKINNMKDAHFRLKVYKIFLFVVVESCPFGK